MNTSPKTNPDMNTAKQDEPFGTTVPHARMPERWLLVGPDEAWCERAREALAAAVPKPDAKETDVPSFLAWRLEHGLLRVAAPAELNDELTQALAAPIANGVQRNATRIWAAMSEADWFKHSAHCDALKLPSARGLNVVLMKAATSGNTSLDIAADLSQSGFLQVADQPDAMSRLTWLMGGRPETVPDTWLTLAPLPERSTEQNAAMADDGYHCYAAWAKAMLNDNTPDELKELWGPFPDDDAEGETDDVVQLDDYLLPRTSQPQVWVANDDRWHQESRLAASSADSHSESDLLRISAPLHAWTFDPPAVARGASQLQVFALPSKAPGGQPCIEWVARWTSSKHMPDNPDDVCLVVTLPKRKPVLLKGRHEREGDTNSLRFAWPSARFPSDAPNSPARLVGWLSELLPLARVSLQ